MGDPIRILHVFGRLDAGGAESRTMDIYRSIDRTKIQFDFAIHTKDECFFSKEVESLGGRIYSFPRFNGKNYQYYKKAWRDFFRKRPEYKIIHGHQTSTGFIYLNEARKNNITTRIAHARNSNKDSFFKRYTTKLARFYATNLFAVSRTAAISEFGEHIIKKGKVKIVPNAIEVSKYKYNEDIRKRKRVELGLNNEIAVVHIGRFHYQKNHKFLLSIFKTLLIQNNNAKLFLVGDGILREEIERKVKELDITNNVHFLGIRTDVPDLLQAMDILVFPSLFEGLPGVVLESQASGLPCVISEEITREVKITDLVEYASLDKEEKYWVKKILNSMVDERRNTYNEIVTKGYDICSVAKWYEDFYIKSLIKK